MRTAGALGAWTTLLYAAHRLCMRLPWPVAVYSYRLVAQPVAPAPRLTGRRADAYNSRFLQPGDRWLTLLPADRATIRQRFAQGAECLAVFRGDTLVASIWLHFGSYREDEVRCRFVTRPAAPTCWDFDVFVDPAHRLSGAFAALWDAADAVMIARGVRVSVSRISTFNLTSLRAHERLGAVPVGRADFFCLGRVQAMRANQRPWLHVGWTKGAVPSLVIDAGAALGPWAQAAPVGRRAGPGDGAFRGHPEG
jgi:hypothetical protein